MLSTAGTASARRHTPDWTAPANAPGSEPAPLPAEKPPTINPDAAPSLGLQPFLNDHLDKILVPLGTAAFAQPDLVAGVRDTYAKALPTAAAARKPAYQLAVAVCDAMINAIAERQKAVKAMEGSYEMRRSESIQPRGGKQAVKDSDKDEAFFYNSQKNTWLQNAAALRQGIAVLNQREHAAETQAAPWTLPTPAPPVVAAAGPTPSVSVPAPATPNGQTPVDDPVVGRWKWDGYMDVTLNADHTINSKRRGTWLFATAADGKRHYEFHYDKHPDWIDLLALSDDGRSLEGANKYGKYVSAQRR